jgi:hypothetical protein
MIKHLTEVEQDYSFSRGFIEEWLKDAPKQVKEHLQILVAGISAYREKYVAAQEDYQRLLADYNRLMAEGARHLQIVQTLQQQLDESLTREQRVYRKDGTEVPLIET